MTVELTTPHPVYESVDDVVLPPVLEQALLLVPDWNLAEQLPLPEGSLGWQGDEAACRTQCTESFYGSVEMGAADQGVRRICATCPLQAACMTHALTYEAWGVWGLTERERGALGGVYARSRQRRGGLPAPRRAAAAAVAAGVDPYALAEALTAVHGRPANGEAPPEGEVPEGEGAVTEPADLRLVTEVAS